MQSLKVTVSSPGELFDEWDQIDSAVGILNDQLERLGSHLRLTKPYRFDTFVPAGVGRGSVQSLAEQHLPITDCHFLIGLFGQRFGTPVDGYDSGTAKELLLAIDHRRRNGNPQVLVYFQRIGNAPSTEEQARDHQLLLGFRRTLGEHNVRWQQFSDAHELGKQVLRDLSAHILPEARPNSNSILCVPVVYPVEMRSESIAELSAPIAIKVLIPDQAKHHLDIELHLNTTATQVTEDPCEAQVVVRATESRRSPNIVARVLGVSIGSTVRFLSVPVERNSELDEVEIQLVNIRVDAFRLGIAMSLTAFSLVTAALRVQEHGRTILESNEIVLGTIRPAASFAGGPHVLIHSRDGLNAVVFEDGNRSFQPSCVICCTAGMRSAFRTRQEEMGLTPVTDKFLFTPTRFSVILRGLPDALRVLVAEDSVVDAPRRLVRLRQYAEEPATHKRYEARPTNFTCQGKRLWELVRQEGIAIAEWEWDPEIPSAWWPLDRPEVFFGFVFAIKSGFSCSASIEAECCLSPATASSRVTVPSAPMFCGSLTRLSLVSLVAEDPLERFEETETISTETTWQVTYERWRPEHPLQAESAELGFLAFGRTIEDARREARRALEGRALERLTGKKWDPFQS